MRFWAIIKWNMLLYFAYNCAMVAQNEKHEKGKTKQNKLMPKQNNMMKINKWIPPPNANEGNSEKKAREIALKK